MFRYPNDLIDIVLVWHEFRRLKHKEIKIHGESIVKITDFNNNKTNTISFD